MKEAEKVYANGANKKRIGRALSYGFVQKLRAGGIYNPIVKAVCEDKDLDMEFRGSDKSTDEYINIYFKGNNILKLYLNGRFHIYEYFKKGLKDIPNLLKDKESINSYLKLLPQIKHNVATHRKKSMEIEYEQLLIRANNKESRNNSEYIIVDRQYVTQKAVGQERSRKDRLDLVAVKWPRKNRNSKHQKGSLVIIEVKYALNPEIAKGSVEQIERYYCYLKENLQSICEEMELILHQKLELGLIERTKSQIEQLKKLKFDRKIDSLEIIVFFIDYNPNSQLKPEMIRNARELSFASQVRIACGGLAMWILSSTSL